MTKLPAFTHADLDMKLIVFTEAEFNVPILPNHRAIRKRLHQYGMGGTPISKVVLAWRWINLRNSPAYQVLRVLNSMGKLHNPEYEDIDDAIHAYLDECWTDFDVEHEHDYREALRNDYQLLHTWPTFANTETEEDFIETARDCHDQRFMMALYLRPIDIVHAWHTAQKYDFPPFTSHP